jgi:WD40 repeat protein
LNLFVLFMAFGCEQNSSVAPPSTSASKDNASSSAEAPSSTPHPTSNASPAVAKTTPVASTNAPPQPTPKQIARWNVPDFTPLQLLSCGDDWPAFCLAVTPEGKQYAVGGAKLSIWNVNESKPTTELLANYTAEEVERPLISLAISPDGNWLAAGDQKGRVRIWTWNDQKQLVLIQAHDSRVAHLAFSPDSKTLATTSYSGEVILWQLPDGNKLKSLKMSNQQIAGLVFLSDKLLAAAGGETNIYNIDTGSKEQTLTSKYVIGPALGLSSDRKVLAFADPDGNVELWDVEAAKSLGARLRGASAHLIAFSPDGKWIATYSNDSNLRIWDVATGAVLQVIDADGDKTSAIAWLPQCNALIMVSVEGRVRIWGTTETAKTLGIEPLATPTLEPLAAGAHRSMSSAQLQRVIDIRSFPRLPGAMPQWSDFGMCAYSAPVSQGEAEAFYRYYLGKAGWTELPQTATIPSMVFQKDGCQLNVSFTPAMVAAGAREGDLQISMNFAGNYDVRWLPKFSPMTSKSGWDSFSSVSYRTKAEITDVEVGLLKQFHDAGWTALSRLAAASNEDPKSRSLSMLQRGSVLTVSIGHPADSQTELFVQTSVSVTNKSVPIPPDAGWIEFDNSTDLQFVINTKMNLQQTIEFYDKQMAAEGWMAREARRQFKDDKAWLPYIRGQEDIFLRLSGLPDGGTRIVAGDAANSSWQLEQAKASDGKPKEDKSEKPGLQAADFALPAGATAVKFDVDFKQIEYEVAGATPTKLGDQFIAQMQALGWKREDSGMVGDDYTFITFTKDKAEVRLRARPQGTSATAQISGDGLLWDKPLPAAPVRISYGTWLRREHKTATLDLLDEFTSEMRKIPAGAK